MKIPPLWVCSFVERRLTLSDWLPTTKSDQSAARNPCPDHVRWPCCPIIWSTSAKDGLYLWLWIMFQAERRPASWRAAELCRTSTKCRCSSRCASTAPRWRPCVTSGPSWGRPSASPSRALPVQSWPFSSQSIHSWINSIHQVYWNSPVIWTLEKNHISTWKPLRSNLFGTVGSWNIVIA